MRRTLSANYTFAYKYVCPVLAGIIFAILSGMAWRGAARDTNGQLLKWAFPVIGGASTIFAFVYPMRFKRVQVDDQALYVSDYKNEIRIPFSDIADVSVQWQGHGRTRGGRGGRATPVVQVEFRQPNVWGEQIKFIAAKPWNFSHSVVEELREWRDRAL